MTQNNRYPTISPEAAYLLGMMDPGPNPMPANEQEAQQQRADARALDGPVLNEYLEKLLSSVERRQFDGVPVEVMIPKSLDPEAGDRYVIYLHGGGYVFGEARDMLGLQLAHETRLPLYSIEYPLAPGVPFPQPVHQAVKAYAAITAELGPNVVMTGISAGGGMVLAMMQEIQRLDLPLPKALGLDTPWTDLSPVGDSYQGNGGRDTLIWDNRLEIAARYYMDGADVANPLVSPIHAEYTASFPPCFISTGTRDLFLSDCARLNRKLRNAGVPTDLQIWEGMWHGFQGKPELPEAIEARKAQAAYLRSWL